MAEPNDNDPPAVERGTGPQRGPTHDPVEQELSELMNADIVALRRQRVPFDEIGRRMAKKYRVDSDEPYARQSMHTRYHKALKDVPAREVTAHRTELTELLNELIDQTYRIAQKDHLAYSQGRLVRMGEPYINDHGEADIAEGRGEPVLDDGPKLHAIGEIRKIANEIARLNGLNIAVKQELGVDAAVNYTINGVDVGKLT